MFVTWGLFYGKYDGYAVVTGKTSVGKSGGVFTIKPIIIMKTNKLITSLTTLAIAAWVAGCDSKPKTDDKPSAPGAESKTNAAAILKEAAGQAVEGAKETAAAVAEKAKVAATAAAAEVKQVATNVVEKTKEAAAAATTEASKAVESVKTSVANTLSDTTTKTDVAATSTTQGLIDKAKALVNDKKYQDALASLAELGTAQLSPEQQKVVSDLKTTIQNALGTDTGKAVQGLFKK